MLEINEHSLHSPFLFDFYIRVVKTARYGNPDERIECLRKKLSKSEQRIQVLRSDSKSQTATSTDLRSICRHGISRPKFSRLYQEIINYFGLQYIIELGTSVGINSLYLARADSSREVWTFENNTELIEIAEKNFKTFHDLNITLFSNHIEDSLPAFLNKKPVIDMVFFDADHRYEATLKYYSLIRDHLSENAVLIFDDIYWSPSMTRAWRKICQDNSKNLILDLYQVGIIIKKNDLPAGYFHLSF